jgi:hypothetical protein
VRRVSPAASLSSSVMRELLYNVNFRDVRDCTPGEQPRCKRATKNLGSRASSKVRVVG